MRVRRSGLLVGLLGAILVAPGVAAAPAVTVITLDVTFGGPETFTATGGVVCASGTATSDAHIAGFGRQGRGVGTFHVLKSLTCTGGGASFDILVNAAGTPTSPGTLGGFVVVGGTGPYEDLRGAGRLVGTGKPDGSGLIDVYTGRLQIGG